MTTTIQVKNMEKGHMYRMKPETPSKIALHWIADGEKKCGRPKEMWQRTRIKRAETVLEQQG